MKGLRRPARAFIACILGVVASNSAAAQVPPHMPGTICATPSFWCWMPYPGAPGAQCACPSPYGWVGGYLI